MRSAFEREFYIKVKVKVTLNRTWRSRGGVDIKLRSFFNLGSRWKWVVNATPRLLYPRGRPCTHTKEAAGWAPLPVWMGTGNLISIRIQSPDDPAHSESLYLICSLDQQTIKWSPQFRTLNSVMLTRANRNQYISKNFVNWVHVETRIAATNITPQSPDNL